MSISVPTAHMKKAFNLKATQSNLSKYTLIVFNKRDSLKSFKKKILAILMRSTKTSISNPIYHFVLFPITIHTEIDPAPTIKGNASCVAISSRLSFM